ncbi:uncharacterized protein LOC123989199 [Osmia bicornis bicornis]|uniref:uncharacterized protein LOC123989199 n=1 Tax=Osmia bicornis bicornis TaxID=1437191 RepID=UPI001EAEC023|nr:uncharacterized protein LOC123989199 [Osmia bicornis bicornis]
MRPADVPDELKDLTVIEQMLIARVHSVMKVYQVRASGRPGQIRYSGNIINVEQDITEITRRLPLTPADVNVLIVQRDGVSGHRDFKVRRDKVLKALEWLKINNPHYSDVNIDMEHVASLLQDGDVSHQIRFLNEGGFTEDVTDETDITESAVPITIQQRQEQAIRSTLQWPSSSTTPINEFRTEGYISMAFPHLFPDGQADIVDFTRNQKLQYSEWCEFLMHYKDKRFANDCRFRFHCLNTLQRHEALIKSAIFCKKNDFTGSIQQLRTELIRNPAILKKLLSWGSKIRGTSTYWYQRRLELQAMVNQLGVPTLFLTLSSADLWWPCMMRHFGISSTEIEGMTEAQLSRLMQEKLNENPLVADEYFSKRVEIFMKILKTKLNIADYWYRFEYQHRGSPHIHAILWLENAPDVRTFDYCFQEEIETHKKFYDSLTSAMNPLINEPPAEVHPSRLKHTELQLYDTHQLSQLLNRVQRHTNHSRYCLKSNRRVQTCRFNFPKPLQDVSTLQKDEKGIWQYTPRRNDALLNDHNIFVAQIWRANTDCKVITSEHAILNYLSKYASKSEPQSQSFMDLFNNILVDCHPDDPVQKAFSKMLIKIVGLRDISSCEVMHLLAGIPLYHCTRHIVKIYIGLDDFNLIPLDDSDQFVHQSILDRYRTRPETTNDMTLSQFATRYNAVRNQLQQCRKMRVLQVLPKYPLGIDDEKDEIIYKQKLLLNKPWRSVEELKTCDSWKESFFAANITVWELDENNTSPHDPDDIPALENEPRDWMAIAEAFPHEAVTDTVLGYRDQDRDFEWYAIIRNYPGLEAQINFIRQAKENYVCQRELATSDNLDLNPGQQNVINHLHNQLVGVTTRKLTVVQGAAGTGKSCLIRKMVTIVESIHGPSSVLLIAPTGMAANNINGTTIHSAFHLMLSRGGAMPDLTGESERNFQDKMSTIKVIICDEMSMVGMKLLATIDQRLRQAYPENQSVEFGGAIMYLLGDFNQLPPVGDTSLLGIAKSPNMLAIRGQLLFEKFNTVFELKQIMRQVGVEQEAYRKTLINIANGKVTDDDYDLLQSRFASNVRSSFTEFSGCIHLKAKKEDIIEYNEHMLRQLNKPVAIIRAKHNNVTAIAGSTDDAQGLPATLWLASDCRVMLTQSLWTAQGLCNGTLGTVADVIYLSTDTDDHLSDFPACVLIRFDNYNGPSIFNGLVPILPQTVSYKKGTTACTRKQFPLDLAYAITIHKSQGITVDRAVVDIGNSEFGLGLTYVALSRVRSLAGLVIEPSFPKTRLTSINNHIGWNRKRPALQRLRNLANLGQ